MKGILLEDELTIDSLGLSAQLYVPDNILNLPVLPPSNSGDLITCSIIRIGLVARICRSQSSKDDQSRQGRGSIPRFGIILLLFVGLTASILQPVAVSIYLPERFEKLVVQHSRRSRSDRRLHTMQMSYGIPTGLCRRSLAL